LVLITEPSAIGAAKWLLRARLGEVERACDWRRDDSELRDLERTAGSEAMVSPLLADVLEAALRAADVTGGLVDPTVGVVTRALDHDRHPAAGGPDGQVPVPAPGWWRLGWDRTRRALLLPRGVPLDVGATAKAWAVDRAAEALAAQLGCGVLVGLGGDVAVAGPAPAGGWRIHLGGDTRPGPDGGHCVAITSGGLASSAAGRRHGGAGGAPVRHIVDPRTGLAVDGPWRTVSVAAGSCVDATTASTAAVVLGSTAVEWLTRSGLPARLVDAHGEVHPVAGWPTQAAIPTVAAPT
jgi:thiamine biosynthesis lipoprotein